MSIFNMFGGAPKKEAGHDDEKIGGSSPEESEVDTRPEVAVDSETLEVLTPGDLEAEKEERKIPENWREQA